MFWERKMPWQERLGYSRGQAGKGNPEQWIRSCPAWRTQVRHLHERMSEFAGNQRSSWASYTDGNQGLERWVRGCALLHKPCGRPLAHSISFRFARQTFIPVLQGWKLGVGSQMRSGCTGLWALIVLTHLSSYLSPDQMWRNILLKPWGLIFLSMAWRK